MTSNFDNLINELYSHNIITEDMDAGQQQPPAIVQKAEATPQQIADKFYKYLMTQENDQNAGYNSKTQRWFPHGSPERGLPTLGYGHKFASKKELDQWKKKYPQGMTSAEIVKLFHQDVIDHFNRAKNQTDKLLGAGTWDKLPFESKLMLTDYEYSPGLSLFPKFNKAVAKQDWKTAYKEHKRYYSRDGKTIEMVRRNNAFAQLYLLPKLK